MNSKESYVSANGNDVGLHFRISERNPVMIDKGCTVGADGMWILQSKRVSSNAKDGRGEIKVNLQAETRDNL